MSLAADFDKFFEERNKENCFLFTFKLTLHSFADLLHNITFIFIVYLFFLRGKVAVSLIFQ
jgi:hypothetical protein